MDLLKNYIGGDWKDVSHTEALDVRNPATNEILGRVPLSTGQDVDRAVQAAAAAFPNWRQTPPTDRVQYLFKLKALLEDSFEEISRLITLENGKTLGESRGEMRRAIENVEVACGIPSLMQGNVLEDIAPGIDEMMIRQPLGPCAIITPFNFPAMISFWFLPYALATGNTAIIKPSERTPLTMNKLLELMDTLELPGGVLSLVHGDAETAEAVIDHPEIKAISFVGSTQAARQVYARAAAKGKRVQAAGGAKNITVVMPDVDFEEIIPIIADSAFGNAGQRCLATSLTVTVGSAGKRFGEAIAESARSRNVGYGLEEGIEMGPVITPESRSRIKGLIRKAEEEGAICAADGRDAVIAGYEEGYFIRPTVLQNLAPEGEVAATEIFGPVLGLIQAESVEEAIEIVNSGRYGNMACLFTKDGSAARRFRYEADAGNIGINIGVAAPMAFFPFSGWKESFFGTLHGQGKHAIEFFTQTKVVVERWLSDWNRKF